MVVGFGDTGAAGGRDCVYDRGLRPSTVARHMAKAKYDLDLSHLHVG